MWKLLADFKAEYGIEVNYDTYDSTEVVEARLLALEAVQRSAPERQIDAQKT